MKVDLSGILSKELKAAVEEYELAAASQNQTEASQKALKCSEIFLRMADGSPERREFYLNSSKKWKTLSKRRVLLPVKNEKTAVKTEGAGNSNPEYEMFKERAESLITKTSVTWQDIGGLENVKRLLMETVVIAGLQKPASVKPWKGVLLFGPPGTGKTLLASAAAGSLNAAFYDVKSESILSKYYGESSKLISALYDSARFHAPSIIFMDEFDSLSQSRGEGSTEAARKVLSTLLTQLDGMQDKKSERLLLTLAATNTPWDIDTASLSRFPRRIYVTLPDEREVKDILSIHLKGLDAGRSNLAIISSKCVENRYSGRDLQNFCQQAMWHMIHDENPNLHKLAELPYEELSSRKLKVRPLVQEDFSEAFERIRSPVTEADILRFEQWNAEYGG